MNAAMLSSLTGLQRDTLRFYVDAIGEAAADVSLHRVGLTVTFRNTTIPRREYVVAEVLVPLDEGPPAHFYGSLGDSSIEAGKRVDHEHQFVGIFESADSDCSHLIAYARLHHQSMGVLDAHSSFLLREDDGLRLRGYTNALVTRADLLAPFKGKNEALLSGIPSRILALLPLDGHEWKIKVEQGIDELFEHFQRTKRDMLALRRALGSES